MARESRRSIVGLLSLVLMVVLAGCAGELPPRGDGASTGDHFVASDSPGTADAEAPCNEGDKRCHGLEWIQECQGGVWQDTVNCSEKEVNGYPCGCSITLMYVCAHGATVCP